MRKLVFTIIIVTAVTTLLTGQVRIKMQEEDGIFTTPCFVNGLRLRFIFDTGASNVSLSISEAVFMLKNGYLDESDLKGSSQAQIANGEIVENTKVNLKELEIGGLKLYNVEAVIIHELSAPLLLGQSAIQKLGKIQLEGDELIIMQYTSSSSENDCINAENLVQKANTYYFDNLYTLSADTYQKAYDLCPTVFDCFDMNLFGNAYYYSDNFQSAIKYLKIALNCEKESQFLFDIHLDLGISYLEIGEYQNAIINSEKSLLYASDDQKKFNSYSNLGDICYEMGKYQDCINYYRKSVDYLLSYKSTNINEISKGNVKDEVIGEVFWNFSLAYAELDIEQEMRATLILSAACGNIKAMDFCNRNGIDYKQWINIRRKNY